MDGDIIQDLTQKLAFSNKLSDDAKLRIVELETQLAAERKENHQLRSARCRVVEVQEQMSKVWEADILLKNELSAAQVALQTSQSDREHDRLGAVTTQKRLERERDEARNWVEKLRGAQVLTCVYCGKEYPPGSPTHGAGVLTAHVKQCEKHPMCAMKRVLEALIGAASDVESHLASWEAILDRAYQCIPADVDDRSYLFHELRAIRRAGPALQSALQAARQC